MLHYASRRDSGCIRWASKWFVLPHGSDFLYYFEDNKVGFIAYRLCLRYIWQPETRLKGIICLVGATVALEVSRSCYHTNYARCNL